MSLSTLRQFFFYFSLLVGAWLLLYLFPIPLLSHTEEAHIIHMTASGFEPSEITITAGEVITFVNFDSKERWPASNIHPTHSVYPDSSIKKCGTEEASIIFDACKPLEPNQEYSFVFNEVGVWTYHDHRYPSSSGTIIVTAKEDEETPNKQISEEKSLAMKLQSGILYISQVSAKLWYTLFPSRLEKKLSTVSLPNVIKDEDALHTLLFIAGPKKIMQKLLEDSSGGSVFDCHQEAHQIGRVSFEVYGAKSFEEGSADCHSGFYHGAMEGFLIQEGTDDLSKKISALCDLFRTHFGTFECLHGVGHGTLAYLNYDVPKSLEKCEGLKDDFSRRSCFGGVFMENIVTGQGLGALEGHETKWLSDDPHFPCNAVSNEYTVQYECYMMQTSWILTLSEYALKPVIAECGRAPKEMVLVCFKSLGRDIAGQTLRKPDAIIESCNLIGRGNNYNACIEGALNVIIDFWGEKLEGQADELCEKVVLPQAQASCMQVKENRMQDFKIR